MQTSGKLSAHKKFNCYYQLALFVCNFGGGATMKIIISSVVLGLSIVNNAFNFVRPVVLPQDYVIVTEF